MLDFILNGQVNAPGLATAGNSAARLTQANFDPGILRPYVGKDGRSYVSLTGNESGKQQVVPLTNAAATLRKDEWIHLDEVVIKTALPRLKSWTDLRAANSYVIPNGMGKTVLESQSMSDISGAVISMDGLNRSDNDRPEFDLVGLPLPIISKDFTMSARQIATSRNSGTPLDTTNAELAARKVAEEIEKLLLGVTSSYQFGGYSVYGYTNFPSRITATITDPTTGGWEPADFLDELLDMRNAAQVKNYFGPFRLYNGLSWDKYLDSDFSTTKGTTTLRQRILSVPDFVSMQTLDYLTGYQVLMVQMTSDVARAVIGMDITTLQWEQQGGMEICLKVMAIMVPQLRADFAGQTGLVHGNVA